MDDDKLPPDPFADPSKWNSDGRWNWLIGTFAILMLLSIVALLWILVLSLGKAAL